MSMFYLGLSVYIVRGFIKENCNIMFEFALLESQAVVEVAYCIVEKKKFVSTGLLEICLLVKSVLSVN